MSAENKKDILKDTKKRETIEMKNIFAMKSKTKDTNRIETTS
jgi:hypothetical protein